MSDIVLKLALLCIFCGPLVKLISKSRLRIVLKKDLVWISGKFSLAVEIPIDAVAVSHKIFKVFYDDF